MKSVKIILYTVSSLLALSIIVGLVWVCYEWVVKFGIPISFLIIPMYVIAIGFVIHLFLSVTEEIEML